MHQWYCAAALAGVVTADMAASHPHLAKAQAKLQGSCAALASVEGFLHSSVTAALAAAIVQVGHSPIGHRNNMNLRFRNPCESPAARLMQVHGNPHGTLL